MRRSEFMFLRRTMTTRRAICTVLFVVGYLSSMGAQEARAPELSPGSARKATPGRTHSADPSFPQTVKLVVSCGTPLQVALEQEVRVRKVGQRVHAMLVDPIYAFDQLVI